MFIPHRIQRLSIVHVSRDPLNVPSKLSGILRDQASEADRPSHFLPRMKHVVGVDADDGHTKELFLVLELVIAVYFSVGTYISILFLVGIKRRFRVFAFHVIEACVEARGFVGTLRNSGRPLTTRSASSCPLVLPFPLCTSEQPVWKV